MVKIGKKQIGMDKEPFIIAEMSGNHNQSLEKALNIVQAAYDSGADALKLQTYTADSMTLDLDNDEFFISDKKSLWEGKSLYNLYQEAFTPWDWHSAIFDKAKELGLICFSSPFDDKAVDFLEDLNVPAYKIASFENSHLPLIKKIAMTGKPIIISTGMASISEINETVNIIREEGCNDLILLKCTSAYPASPSESNILTIPHMRDLFNCEVGLSDHTIGFGTALASVAHGASVIEKHFTLDRSEGGVDSQFSIEPKELKNLVIETKNAWKSLGSISYGVTDSEKKSIIFRRSIYISKDIKKGDTLSQDNMKIIRPGRGLLPKYFEIVLGRKIKFNATKGTPLSWDLIE